MPLKRAPATGNFELRSPYLLTIKDLITIVSVAISLAIAWGVFDTRITVLEKEMVSQVIANAKETSDISDANLQIEKLQSRVQDTERSIDDLYGILHQPIPRRSVDSN